MPYRKINILLNALIVLQLCFAACNERRASPDAGTDTLTYLESPVLKDTVHFRNTVGVIDSSLKAGLMAYYPFSGDFRDASGNGFDLTGMNGAGLGADTAGNANAAASLDGVNDFLFVNDHGRLYSDQFSVSLLFKMNNGGKRLCLASHVNYERATAFHFNLGLYADATTGFAVGRPLKYACSAIQENDRSIEVSGRNHLTPNEWHSLVAIFNNGRLFLYIDRQLVDANEAGFNISNNCEQSQLTIGSWWKKDGVYFDGLIDEFRLYNRALGSSEIDYLGKPNLKPGR
ncbi:LamG domain-containing protein [Flavihumibacter petaseus]|uniref:LamG-like jellyroll fold domain-containing protein n=1 Tax=Flavihumibacter petaseus NBRC 106054 TaxID=1220578 RepID=A0A0E9N052_9BACT|nr:LamG domain-containing protein [Flavihumibacter petaseus]GAO43001.1 hypothetical protein FPE01S_02_01060 [Flavihumibacter petaseus NBRC 106054]